MTTTATQTVSTVIAGTTITSTIRRTEEIAERVSLSMAAGLAGTLSTRTDNDTGVLTVATGHGITISDTVAVFWNGGFVKNCDVTAVTSTTISIDAAIGDNLPTATTAIVVSKQNSYSLLLSGDTLRVMAISCGQRALVDFRSSAPATLLAYDMAESEGRTWLSESDVTNPLAGDTVATVHVANGGTTAATVAIGFLKSGD